MISGKIKTPSKSNSRLASAKKDGSNPPSPTKETLDISRTDGNSQLQKRQATIKDGVKRLPSRSGRDASQGRKGKNSSGTGMIAGTMSAGNEDYNQNSQMMKYKTLYYTGRPITKDEFAKDFLELKTESEKVKLLGQGVMKEFRNTRRFGAQTQGPSSKPWVNTSNLNPGHGQSYSFIPNDKILKIL